MLKNTEKLFAILLLISPLVARTAQDFEQEVLGQQEVVVTSTEQSAEYDQDQFEKDYEARQDKAWQEFKNDIKSGVKSAYVNLLVAYGLIEPLGHIITVGHELGHAAVNQIFFPGTIKGINCLPHVVKTTKGKYILAEGSVSILRDLFKCPNPDSSLSSVVFKTQNTLMFAAGPIAGAATGIALGRLSKHKQCPEWLKWPLRVLSCALPVQQLIDNLVPNSGINDGERIFKIWGGQDGPSTARSRVEWSVWGLSCATGMYLVHREFPQFFKKIKDFAIDFHESMQD